MMWTLSYRGFDRQWQRASVEATTREEAVRKLEKEGYRSVFSFAARDVRLEPETATARVTQ